VLGYFRLSSRLVFTNAGHLPPLWYHAAENRWGLLEDCTPEAESEVSGLPLGLIPGTEYRQTAVPLALNDFLMIYTDGFSEAIYTDGFSEAVNEAGQELGQQGLLELARSLPLDSPAAAGQALLDPGCAPAHYLATDDLIHLRLRKGGLAESVGCRGPASDPGMRHSC
jgi:serine phosphatase RsbU (regulator of sigma subunit)